MNRHDMITDRNAASYVERFLNGETTNAEEKALYDYFSRPDLPGELEEYRDMFSYYASGLDQRLLPSDTQDGESRQAAPAKKKRLAFLTVATSAAACLAVFFGIRQIEEYRYWNELAQVHAGSFAIVQGKKTTDIKALYPFILKSEKDFEQFGATDDERMQARERQLEKELLESIDDPETKKEIEQLLCNNNP